MKHKPGTLADITRQLSKAKINIEYAYGSVTPPPLVIVLVYP